MDQLRNDAKSPSPSTPRPPAAGRGKDRKEGKKPQQFLFINSSKPPRHHRNAGNRNVRSFVMQRARALTPWSTSKQAGKATPPESATPVASSARAITRKAKARKSAKRAAAEGVDAPLCSSCEQLPSMPSRQDVVDPFDNFPVQVDTRTSVLWDHFFTVMAVDSVPVDIYKRSSILKSGWFSAALTSEGLMHSVLCSIALHRYAMGLGPFLDISYHKARAVSAVNAMLSDPESRTSDANIGAVFNLMCVEESLNQPLIKHNETKEGEELDQRIIHLNGLKEMVRMRGGIGALESKTLAGFMMRHSAAHSIASFYPPYMSWYSTFNDSCYYLQRAGDDTSGSSAFEALCDDLNLDVHLLRIIGALSVYIGELNDWYSKTTPGLDPHQLQDAASYFTCCLIEWLNDDAGGDRHLIDEAVCIALLMFIFLTTESADRNLQPLHFTATKRLQEVLNSLHPSVWSSAPEMLLWILAIGSVGAVGSAEHAWFACQTAQACGKYGVNSANALVALVERCLWVGFKLEEPVRRVWADATELNAQPQPKAVGA